MDTRSSHVVMHGCLGDVALEGTTLRLGGATCLSQLLITNATAVLHAMLNALIENRNTMWGAASHWILGHSRMWGKRWTCDPHLQLLIQKWGLRVAPAPQPPCPKSARINLAAPTQRRQGSKTTAKLQWSAIQCEGVWRCLSHLQWLHCNVNGHPTHPATNVRRPLNVQNQTMSGQPLFRLNSH